MNKNDLIEVIATAADISKKEAELALNGFVDAVNNAMTGGESVILTGFGTFSTKARAARTGRNPQTGKTIQIPAKKVVKFKPGKTMAAAVE